jgi:Zn-dependent oligopeptidase
MLKTYFELNQVKSGIFGLATKLYRITFKQISILFINLILRILGKK